MGQAQSQCAQLFGSTTVDQSLLVPSSKPANSDKKWDLKRLRAFILAGKLAPFLPSSEDGMVTQEQRQVAPQLLKLLKHKKQVLAPQDQVDLFESLEECPICMLHFQALNTSLCCQKRICTECYLQVQTCAGQNLLPTCPFCKLPGYVAKFQGAKTKIEREQDQQEEQKVIESRIREREEERRCDEERELNRINQEIERQQQAAQRASQGLPPEDEEQQGRDATSDGVRGARGTSMVEQHTRAAAQAAAASDEERVSATHLTRHHHHHHHHHHSHHPEEQHAQHSRGTEDPIPSISPSLQQQREREERRMRRHQLRSARRQQADEDMSYRVNDFLPSGITDVSVSVEDINELMLEQAMYESLRISMGSQQHQQQEQESPQQQQQQSRPRRQARQERRRDRSASPAPAETQTVPARYARRLSPLFPPTDAPPASGHRRSSYASTPTTDHSSSYATVDHPTHQPPFSPAAHPEPNTFLLNNEVMGDSAPHAPRSTTPTHSSHSASHSVLPPPQQPRQQGGSSAAHGGAHDNRSSRAALCVSLPTSGTLPPPLMPSPTTNTTFTSATSRTPQSTTPVPSLDGAPAVCAPWAETPSLTPTDPPSPAPTDDPIALRRTVRSAQQDPSPEPAPPRRAITTASDADTDAVAGDSGAPVPRTATTSVVEHEGGDGHPNADASYRRRTRSRGAQRARHLGSSALHDESLLPPEARMSEAEAIALAIRQSLAESARQQPPPPTDKSARASPPRNAPASSAPPAQQTLPSLTPTPTLEPLPLAPNTSDSASPSANYKAGITGHTPGGASATSGSAAATADAAERMQGIGGGAGATHAHGSSAAKGMRTRGDAQAGGGNGGGAADSTHKYVQNFELDTQIGYEERSGGEWAGQQQAPGQAGGVSNLEQEEEDGTLVSKRMGALVEGRRRTPSAASDHAAPNPSAAGSSGAPKTTVAHETAPSGVAASEATASCGSAPIAAAAGAAPATVGGGTKGGPFASVAGTPVGAGVMGGGGGGGDGSDAPTAYSPELPQPSTADTALDSHMSGCSSLPAPVYEQEQEQEQEKERRQKGGSVEHELLMVESNPTYLWSMTSSHCGTNMRHPGSVAKASASPTNSKDGSVFSATCGSDFRASPTSSKHASHSGSPEQQCQLGKRATSKHASQSGSPAQYQLGRGGGPQSDLQSHGAHGQQMGMESGNVQHNYQQQQKQQQQQTQGLAPPWPPPPSPPIPPSPSPMPPPLLLSSSPSLSLAQPCDFADPISHQPRNSSSNSSISLLHPSQLHAQRLSPDSLVLSFPPPQTHQPPEPLSDACRPHNSHSTHHDQTHQLPEPQEDACAFGASAVPLSRLVAMASAAGVPGPAGIAAQQEREHGPQFVGMVGGVMWAASHARQRQQREQQRQQQQQVELQQPLLEAEVQHPQQQGSQPSLLRPSLQHHQLQQDLQLRSSFHSAAGLEVQQEPVGTAPADHPPLVAENPDGSVCMVVATHGVPRGCVASDAGACYVAGAAQQNRGAGAAQSEDLVEPPTVEAYILQGNSARSRACGGGGVGGGPDAPLLPGGASQRNLSSVAGTGGVAAASTQVRARWAEERFARAWEEELEAQQAAIDAQGYEDYDLGEENGVLPTYVARGSGPGSRAEDDRVRAATAAEDEEMRRRVALYDACVQAQESSLEGGRGSG